MKENTIFSRLGLLLFLLFGLIILVWSSSLQELTNQSNSGAARSAHDVQGMLLQGSSLPELVYLGRGGSYTNDPGFNFIVKRLAPFRFEFEPGPTYTAAATEDVWRSFGTGGNPPALFEQDIELGPVTANCTVNYIAIDDQEDGRRNRFLLDDVEVVHLMPEGLVVEGSFTVPRDGVLFYDARDSVAIYLDLCGGGNPLETPTETAVPTETATATETPNISETPPITPTVPITTTPASTATPTLTATPDGTVTPPSATETPTLLPGVTLTPLGLDTPTPVATSTLPPATPSVTASPTVTRRPPEKACLRINFEVGGDVARNGRYVVEEVSGRQLASWTAEAGWQDSGWIRGIETSHDSVYVDVYFEPADGSPRVKMRMLNPAPGTTHGWVSRGVCHALEVAW